MTEKAISPLRRRARELNWRYRWVAQDTLRYCVRWEALQIGQSSKVYCNTSGPFTTRGVKGRVADSSLVLTSSSSMLRSQKLAADHAASPMDSRERHHPLPCSQQASSLV